MSEASIRKSIIRYLKKKGWYGIPMMACSYSGIPDLLCLHIHRFPIFFEIKNGDKGVVSNIQEATIKKINNQCKVKAYVVRSLDDVKIIVERR